MNRRNFLSKLVGAAAVVTVAPAVLAKEPVKLPIAVDVSRIPDGMSLEEFIKEWERSGLFIYRDPPPVLYLGENKYRQFEEACREYMDSVLSMPLPEAAYHNNKFISLKGVKIVKHPLLGPDDSYKTTNDKRGWKRWNGEIF